MRRTTTSPTGRPMARGSCCVWQVRDSRPSQSWMSDSGRVTPLVPTPEGRVDNMAKWSPKGDLIAFTSNRDGDYEIYTDPSRWHGADAPDQQPRQQRARGVVTGWQMDRVLERTRRVQGRNGARRRRSADARHLRDARGWQRPAAAHGRCGGGRDGDVRVEVMADTGTS